MAGGGVLTASAELQMNKIEHQTLNDRAYGEIRKGLISSRFQPGQVLVIRNLAEAYGISTTPVREALQRLVAERLLILLPNRSIAVPSLSVEKFTELARIRCALEGLAAELAVANIRAPQIKKLRSLLAEIDEAIAVRDSRLYANLNQKFHFVIYERANSPHLLQMVQDLWSQVGPFFNGLLEDESFLKNANKQHEQIVAAVEDGKPAAVREAIVKDITVAADSLTPRLSP
jgi:DNA-binding GntR family transcriptional regulator